MYNQFLGFANEFQTARGREYVQNHEGFQESRMNKGWKKQEKDGDARYARAKT